MQEIKEVELRSRRGKFIYNKTYNPVRSNKVNHFSRRGRAPSRLPMKRLKSLLKKTRIVILFVWNGILKNTPLLACVASVSVRFRSKERGTGVKDRATNGASKRTVRLLAFVLFLVPRSFFAPKLNGNACYAGYTIVI